VIVHRHNGLSCPDATCWHQTAPPNVCTALPTAQCGPAVPSFHADVTGVCDVTSPPGPLPWQWAVQARGCEPNAIDTGLCGDPASLCVPSNDGLGPLCVVHDGNLACPPEYPAKRDLFANADDQRTCSECTCGPTVSVGKLHGFLDAACSSVVSGPGVDVPMPCSALLVGAGVNAVKFVPAAAGSNLDCEPLEVPQRDNEVAPVDPVTVCCLP